METKTINQNFQKVQIELFELLKETNKEGNKFPGELGIERVKNALKLFGSPQNELKIFHIAGTSGKGSTCYILSSILISQGFSVGLTLSPHILDIRERIQINNELISKEDFINLYTQVKETTKAYPLTYFEILTVMAFVYFKSKSLDFCVIETGLGGTFDATNVIDSSEKICLITRIGLDHTHILGNTVKEIAAQKAGIIGSSNKVFTVKQEAVVNETLESFADITYVNSDKYSEFKVGLIGNYQKENASLALSAFDYLSQRENFQIDWTKVSNTLKELKLFGRFSEIKLEPLENKVVLDGAHNPQKIGAFVNALKEHFPEKDFVFVVAFKHGKDISENLKPIVKSAKKIYLTTYKNEKYNYMPEDTDIINLKASIKALGFTNYEIEPNLNLLVKTLFNSKKELKNCIIVFTGSFYLISRLVKDYDI